MAASRTLNVAVTGDTRDFERATARASSASGKFAKSTEHAHVRIRRSFMGMTASAAKAGAGIAAAYVSIEGAKRAISTTEDLAHATISLHKNLGLSVEKASEWAAVARSRNIDTKALNMSFGTLSKNILASHDATSKQAEVFKQLGVSQAALRSGDFNRVLGDTADALQKMGPGADRTATAMKLFGRGWQTVVPVLRDGSKAMREQLKLAEDSGATFKGKSIKSLEDFIKAQRAAKLSVMGLQVAFGTELAPVLTKVLSSFSKFTREMRDGTGAGGRFAAKMREVWSDLKPIVSTLKDAAEWLGKHPHLLAAAGAAWATYKTAALVQIGIVKAAELGLFGGGMRTRLASEAGKTGTVAGKGFAAKAGLAAVAGIGGWEIGKALRKHVPVARDVGDFIGNALGKAVFGSASKWIEKIALGAVSPLGLLAKEGSKLFSGSGPAKIPTVPMRGSPNAPRTAPSPGRGQGGPRGTGRTSARASSVGGPTARASAKRFYSQAECRALWIAAGGPGGAVADTAAAIAMAESGGDSQVVNSIGATGLWQIHPGGSQYLDPMVNARTAVGKYRAAGGFSPWTVYTGADTPGHAKTYLQYLGGSAPARGGGGGGGGAAPQQVRKAPPIPRVRIPNWQNWDTKAWEILSHPGPIAKAKPVAVDTTIDNQWLQAMLTHIDNQIAAGLDATQGNAMKRQVLQGALDNGLTGESRLVAQGMIRSLEDELKPVAEAFSSVLQGALSDIEAQVGAGDISDEEAVARKRVLIQQNLANPDLSPSDVLQFRAMLHELNRFAPVLTQALSDIDLSQHAGDLTEEQARQAKIDLIIANLANPDLTERERLEFRGELRDLQQQTIQAQQDLAAALNALTDELKRQTNMAEAVQDTENFQLKKYLADVLSGQFGRGVVARSFTPGAGVEVAY